MESIRETVLNGVIKFITGVCDNHEDTRGLYVIRRYEDGVRPNSSKFENSCENYGASAFMEVNIENLSRLNTCKSFEFNDQGQYQEISIKNYEVEIKVDVFGCGSLDVSKIVLDAIELFELRRSLLPNNLGYLNHTDVIDVTALQETMHEERVTFSLNFEYCCEAVADIPKVDFSACLKKLINNKKLDCEDLNKI